jgi:hypothetical protein
MHCCDACLHIYEKCVLALPCLSVHFSVALSCWPISLSASISSACTGRIFGKLILGYCMEICQENPNLVKIGQKYWALYLKTEVRIVVGNINLP